MANTQHTRAGWLVFLKKYSRYWVNPALVLFSVSITLCAAEIYLRIYLVRFGPIMLDEQMGWRATPNLRHTGQVIDQDGSTYAVTISQDERGFRMYGDPASPRPSLFVLGDSYTQAAQASDGRTYYALLGERLNAEIFAYGLAGGGTLQEYMVLDRYLDEISPDFILWEYCSNDFINNSYDLELNSKFDNNRVVRPYLEDGQIVYRIPRPYPPLVAKLVTRSYLLQFILEKIYLVQVSEGQDTVESLIERDGLDYPQFARSYQATQQIMAMVKSRAGDTPVVTFECDTASPVRSAAFKEISRQLGFYYIDELGQALIEARQQGKPIFVADGSHWNEAGHALVAETIGAYLEENFPAFHQAKTQISDALSSWR